MVLIMNWRSWPGWLRFILAVCIVFIVIFILALIIGSLGGFDWHFDIGHFHWDFGVTKTGG